MARDFVLRSTRAGASNVPARYSSRPRRRAASFNNDDVITNNAISNDTSINDTNVADNIGHNDAVPVESNTVETNNDDSRPPENTAIETE
jgi:hypothetical protein